MNSLERRRIAKAAGGAIHMLVADGPDDRDEFADDEVPCCMSSAMRGPRACVCWVPVYDLEQVDPDLSVQPSTRSDCCDDCAYRNGSLERDSGLTDALLDVAGDGSRFACHKGMRRVILWRHPDGRECVAGDGDYQPPLIGLVAFKADGSPADYCAGWDAHRRRLLESAA